MVTVRERRTILKSLVEHTGVIGYGAGDFHPTELCVFDRQSRFIRVVPEYVFEDLRRRELIRECTFIGARGDWAPTEAGELEARR